MITRPLAIALTLVGADPPSDADFPAAPLELRGYQLFDLGAADVNGDGHLDLYTANHTARQSLLLGDGAGGFIDVLSAWGLDQARGVPGFEDGDELPALAAGTVSIAWHRRHVVLRSSGAAVAGSFTMLSEVEVVEARGLDVEKRETALEGDVVRTTLAFRAEADADAKLSFRPRFLAVPLAIAFDEGVDLAAVRLGAHDVRPASRAIEALLRDRHGIAWADLDDDGRCDVFMSRGGLRGRLGAFPIAFEDELLMRRGDAFEDRGAEAGLVKGDCRARQVALVDFDGDGRLDIYVGGSRTPNQLWRRRADGSFEDAAGRAGLGAVDDGLLAWIDADSDGDLDALVAGVSDLALLVNEGGRFTSRVIEPNRGGGTRVFRRYKHTGRPALGDFDGDGDLDVYVASPAGSTLLVRGPNGFDAAAPQAFGLPERAYTASWVDVDNDGDLDLHALPGGLFIQVETARFEATGALAIEDGPDVIEAFATWFDADLDGRRDVVMATVRQVAGGESDVTSELRMNRVRGGHWLAIDLEGADGNRPAIGASILVKRPDGAHQRLAVGAGDGAHFSQGLYRIDVGLGAAGRAVIEVTWPDGREETHDVTAVDRRIVIRHPDRAEQERDAGRPADPG